MHPVFTATEILKEFDPPSSLHPSGMGKVEGIKSFMEQTLQILRDTFQNLQFLIEHPGQIYLLDDTFYMDNFVLEMNANYLPRVDALEVTLPKNRAETAINLSISLTQDIKDIKGRLVFAANQFYDVRVLSQKSFKLLAPNGVQVTTLKNISKESAAISGLTIASVKRSTHVSRTSTKTGVTNEFPSVVIPWMPGQMDQFVENRQRGCGTFGSGSILTIKLDAPRKRLWLCNGVSGSGNLQGIPNEDDPSARMFALDFSVLRPFVAFSSKFQNVLLMPELPAVIIEVHKKTLSLEARLSALTSEFSELGGSHSLILFGFSKRFLELNAENSQPKIDIIEAKLLKRFEGVAGISSKFDYLNFKMFRLYVNSSDSIEQVFSIFKLDTLICQNYFFRRLTVNIAGLQG
jgi:hypothetical protein